MKFGSLMAQCDELSSFDPQSDIDPIVVESEVSP